MDVRALGTESAVRWLLDGRLVGVSNAGGSLTLELATPREHRLTAVAETEAWDRIGFRVLGR